MNKFSVMTIRPSSALGRLWPLLMDVLYYATASRYHRADFEVLYNGNFDGCRPEGWVRGKVRRRVLPTTVC
jgi:hypothetical protein